MNESNNSESEKNSNTITKYDNSNNIKKNNIDETMKLRPDYNLNNEKNNFFSESDSINKSSISCPNFENLDDKENVFYAKFKEKNLIVILENNIEKKQLKIFVKDNETVENFYYIYIGDIDELQKTDNFFKVFDNINEIFEELCRHMKNNDSYEFILENKTNLVLKLKVIVGTKERKINFQFDKKNLNNEQVMNNLIKKVNKIEPELKKTKDEYKKLKEKTEYLEKIILEENLITDEKIQKINSSLITQKQNYYLLVKGFEISTGNCNNFQLTLLYKSSIHGDNKNNLFNKCKPSKNILILIKTNSGNVFGLYNEYEWSEKNYNENNFVFSFDKKKIYPGKSGQNNSIISLDKYYILINGVGGLNEENFMKQNNNFLLPLDTNKKVWKNFCKDNELNNGETKFIVKEMEVFKVNFN